MNASGFDLILRAIDLSFDRRKLLLAILGAVATVVVGGLFVWIGTQLARDAGILALLFYMVGLIGAVATMTVFSGAITRISYGDLIGQPVRSAGEALSAALGRLPTLLLSPLLMFLGVGAVLLIEALALLLGRIPILGELIVSIAFVPLVLFNAFLLIVVAVSAWLIFPIAIVENAGIIQAIQRTIELTRRAPGRIMLYLVMAGVLSIIIVVGVGLLLLLAYSLTLTLTVSSMSFERAMQMGLSNFAFLMGPFGGLSSLYYYGGFGGFAYQAPPITMSIAAVLIMLGTAVLWFGVAFALPNVFNLTASCAVYLSVSGQTPAPRPAASPQPAWPPVPPQPMPQPAPRPAPQPQSPYTPPVMPPTPSPVQYTPTVAQQLQAYPPMPPAPQPMPPMARLCVKCAKPLASPTSRFCQACGTQQPQ